MRDDDNKFIKDDGVYEVLSQEKKSDFEKSKNEPSLKKETQLVLNKMKREESCLEDPTIRRTVGLAKAMAGITAGAIVAGAVTMAALTNNDDELESHTISFDYNIEVEDSEASQQIKVGAKVSEIVPKKVRGYKFMGWYKDELFTEPYLEDDILPANATLYGKYLPIYKLNFPEDTTGYTIILEDKDIVLGEDFSFEVKLLNSHSKSPVKVYLTREGGEEREELIKNGEGKYKIVNIESHCSIEVEGIELNTYTVTFKNGVNVLKKETITHNQLVTSDGIDTPTKEYHEFIGWGLSLDSDEVVDLSTYNIKEDTILHAKFNHIEYAVKFINGSDGELNHWTFNVKAGQYLPASITLPTPDPSKASTKSHYYIFKGWSLTENGEVITDFSNIQITSELKLYAVYTEEWFEFKINLDISPNIDLVTIDVLRGDETFTLTSKTPVELLTLRYGDIISISATPKTGHSAKSIAIQGGVDNLNNGKYQVNGYTSIDIIVSEELLDCEVKFVSEGRIVETQDVKFFESPTQPDEPEKIDTHEFDYTFSHWSLTENGSAVDVANYVVENTSVTFYAVYDGDYWDFVLNIFDADHTDTKIIVHRDNETFEITSSSTAVNRTLRYGDILEVVNTNNEGYKVTNVLAEGEVALQENGRYLVTDKDGLIGNGVISLTIQDEIIQCNVQFISDGQIINTQTINYFDFATLPTDPIKENTINKYFIFSHWSLTEGGEEVDISNYTIKGDEVFYAVFNENYLEFDLNIAYLENIDISVEVTRNGELLGTFTSEDNVKLHYGDILEVTATPHEGYSLGAVLVDGGAISNADGTYTINGDGDVTISASDEMFMCAVVFLSDGNEISTQTIQYGQTPTLPSQPEKEDTDALDYTFSHWSLTENGEPIDVINYPIKSTSVTFYAVYSSEYWDYMVTITPANHITTKLIVTRNGNTFEITPSSSAIERSLRYGDIIEIVNTPSEGYSVKNVSVSGEIEESGSYYIVINKDGEVGDGVISVVVTEEVSAHSVTFNIDGQEQSAQLSIGENLLDQICTTMNVTPEEIDYLTIGIYYDDKFTQPIGSDDIVPSESITLYTRMATLNKLTITDGLAEPKDTSVVGDIVLPKTVTKIGSFGDRDITSIVIPSTVTEMEEGAFALCSKLTNIIIVGDNNYFTFEDGVLFNKNKSSIVYCASGKTGSYVIPSTVTSIYEGAFAFSQLSNITIPSTVTSIGAYAFAFSQLGSITIPNSVVEMGEGAFAMCAQLQSVTFESGSKLESIAPMTFSHCTSLKNITIPASVKTIGDYVFAPEESYWEDILVMLLSGSDEYLQYVVPLESITFEEGSVLENIGIGAFAGTTMSSISLPSSVNTIGDGAFALCINLKNIILPSSTKSIGAAVFTFALSLENVTLNNELESIGEGAFELSAISSIYIPASVVSMDGAFRLSNLDVIEVDKNNAYYSSEDNVLYNKDKTTLIYCPQSKNGHFVIPSGVQRIKHLAFSNSNLSGLTIPSSVIIIENDLFNNGDEWFGQANGLTSIIFEDTNGWFSADNENAVIGASVSGEISDASKAANYLKRYYSNNVFIIKGNMGINIDGENQCCKLTEGNNLLDELNKVTNITNNNSIGWYIDAEFKNPVTADMVVTSSTVVYTRMATLDKITIEDGVVDKKNSDITGEVVLPKSVTTIADGAFSETGITSIVIPSSVNEYRFGGFASETLVAIFVVGDNDYFSSEDGVLFNKNKSSVVCCASGKTGSYVIPSTVASIGDTAFAFSQLSNITIPSTVTSIGAYAFAYSQLGSITMPNSVVEMGEGAFAMCAQLQSVTFESGSKLESIAPMTFSYCTSLKSITIPASVKTIGDYAFAPDLQKINEITLAMLFIDSGLEEVEQQLLPYIVPLESVVFEEGSKLETIGAYAFACTTIPDITIPENVKSINEGVFAGCSKMTSVVLPLGLTSIGNGSFVCTALNNINIPNAVESIGDGVFIFSAIESFNIPASVKYLGELALGYQATINVDENNPNYSSVDGVLFNKNKTELIRCMLEGIDYVIPSTVQKISNLAFAGSSIHTLIIPSSVVFIGENIFASAHDFGSGSVSSVVFEEPGGWYVTTDESATGGTDLSSEDLSNTSSATLYLRSTHTFKYWKKAMVTLNLVVDGETTGYSVSKVSDVFNKVATLREDINEDNSIGWYLDAEYTIPLTEGTLVTAGMSLYTRMASLDKITVTDGVVMASSTSISGEVVLPKSITSIADNAFSNCTNLTSIVIPRGVTSIGIFAFENCTNLTSVTFEDPSIWYVSSSSGAESGIDVSSDIVDTRNATTYLIDTYKSYYWKAVVVELNLVVDGETTSYSVVKNSNASSKVALLRGDVNENNSIGWYLDSEYTIPLTGDTLITSDMILYTRMATLDKIVITNGMVKASSTSISGEVLLPKSVTSIADYAFSNCTTLTSIVIPASVISIGQYAFNGCTASITFAEDSQLTSIGQSAFSGCKGASIEIPASVTIIGMSAFNGCTNLTSIVIPASVTSIGQSTFSGCASLTSIVIPAGVTSIGQSAFSGCASLTSIEIPASVTSIENYAFSDCTSLTSIEIPVGVTSIRYRAFSGCTSLTSIEIPTGVTSIGDYAFYNCKSLTSVEIPASVTSIGYDAFYGCASLTSIEIPAGLTRIESYVFYGCTSLTSINVDSGNSKYSSEDGVLFNKNKTTLIKYPAGKSESSYVIPSGVTSIESCVFYDCRNLTSIEIPAGVTSIGSSAFSGCKSLTSITIPAGVTSIGNHAFYGCKSLTSITISASVTSIGSYAFNGCTSLTSVTFADPSGWYVASSSSATTGTDVSSDIADAGTAATYLKSTYQSYYWKKKTS